MKFNGDRVRVSPLAKIAPSARIGDGAVVYDNVVIGENVVIGNDCVIGEPQSEYYDSGDYENPKTTIAAGSLIRSHSIIYSGVNIDANFSCGHRVTIRERTTFGVNCRVGTNADIQSDVEVGDCSWFHSGVFVSSGSRIGRFVLIYPHVIMLDDKRPPSENLSPVEIEDFAQVGAGACLTPGVRIGEQSLVGTGSVVTKNVVQYSCVTGNPAKHVKDVREMKLPDGSAAYPWPYRFERGMPWEGVGFDQWKRSQL